jgi:hypothetical protein
MTIALFLLTVTALLLFAYGVVNKNWFIIVVNSYSIVSLVTLLIMWIQ